MLRQTFLVLCALSAIGARPAIAAPLAFVIDPAQSSLTFTAIEAPIPVPLSEQSPGSLTDALGGTVLADVNGATIMSLAAAIDPAAQGPYIPMVGGYEPNIGYEYSVFLLSTSGFLADLSISLTGGAAGQTAEIIAGTNVYTGPLLAIFEESLAGLTATNGGAPASISYLGNLATLTIPANLGFPLKVGDVDVTLRFTGQVVATARVPEPGSLALASLGLALTGGGAVLRRRRQIASA